LPVAAINHFNDGVVIGGKRPVRYPGAPGNAILIADLDRQGRILRTSLH
jgi:hypothetical protein